MRSFDSLKLGQIGSLLAVGFVSFSVVACSGASSGGDGTGTSTSGTKPGGSSGGGSGSGSGGGSGSGSGGGSSSGGGSGGGTSSGGGGSSMSASCCLGSSYYSCPSESASNDCFNKGDPGTCSRQSSHDSQCCSSSGFSCTSGSDCCSGKCADDPENPGEKACQ